MQQRVDGHQTHLTHSSTLCSCTLGDHRGVGPWQQVIPEIIIVSLRSKPENHRRLD